MQFFCFGCVKKSDLDSFLFAFFFSLVDIYRNIFRLVTYNGTFTPPKASSNVIEGGVEDEIDVRYDG